MKRWLILLLLSSQVIADSNSMSFSIPSISSVSGNNAVVPIIGKEGNDPQTKDIGLYARLIIPLDAPSERINCNTLYQLELQRRRLEVERLKQEIEYLKQLQNDGAFNN